jgi:transposase
MDLEAGMSVKRKKYSKQFKLDTIAAYEAGDKSMAKMERELGIADGLLRRWRMELQKVGDEAEVFPGNGNLPDSDGVRHYHLPTNRYQPFLPIRHTGLENTPGFHR